MWRSLRAGLAATIGLCFATSAFAEVRIYGDPGGEVSAYLQKYQEMRASGERVVIDGPCLSACTLLTGIIPRDRVCVTARAELCFHMAAYPGPYGTLVPSLRGSHLVMSHYPRRIRQWITHHGGLKPNIIKMQGRELTNYYQQCRQ